MCLTSVNIFLIGYYFYLSTVRMLEGSEDEYKTNHSANTFKDGLEVFNISNSTFLPTINIQKMNMFDTRSKE